MISEKLLTYLHNDIQLYDEKEGKDYLIAFGKGKNDELKCCQVTFYHYNFWHLIGEYRQARQEMKDYQTAKYNIDRFLQTEEQEKQAEKQKQNTKAR